MTKLHYIIFSFLFLSVSLNNFAMESRILTKRDSSASQDEKANSVTEKPKKRSRSQRRNALRKRGFKKRSKKRNGKKKLDNQMQSISLPNSPEKSPQGSDSDSPQSISLPGSPRSANNPNDINLKDIQLDEEGDEAAADEEQGEKKSAAKKLLFDDIVSSVGQQLNLSDESLNEEAAESAEHKNCDGSETDSITDDVEKDEETSGSPTGTVIINDTSNKGEKKPDAIDQNATNEDEQLEDSDDTENGISAENFSRDNSGEEPEDLDGRELEESGLMSRSEKDEVAPNREEEAVDRLVEADKNENSSSQANGQSVLEEQPIKNEEIEHEITSEIVAEAGQGNIDRADNGAISEENDCEEVHPPLHNSILEGSESARKSEEEAERVKKLMKAVVEQIAEVASDGVDIGSKKGESASEDEDLDESQKEDTVDSKDQVKKASENLSPEEIERRKLVARGLKKYLVFARKNNPDNLPIDIPCDEELIEWANINEDGEIKQNLTSSTHNDTHTQGRSEIQQTETPTDDPITPIITSEDRPRRSSSKILPAIIAVTGIGVIGAIVYKWVKDLPLIRSKKAEDNNSEKNNDEKTK